jgi:hypothetical protein
MICARSVRWRRSYRDERLRINQVIRHQSIVIDTAIGGTGMFPGFSAWED